MSDKMSDNSVMDNMNNMKHHMKGGKKSRKTKKRTGNDWTRLVTKTFRKNKKSDKNYTFKQAILDSKKIYKKGGNHDSNPVTNMPDQAKKDAEHIKQTMGLGGKKNNKDDKEEEEDEEEKKGGNDKNDDKDEEEKKGGNDKNDDKDEEEKKGGKKSQK